MRARTVTFVVNGNGCHIVISHRPMKMGHVRVLRNGAHEMLHRIVYREQVGPIPNGKCVRHKCDTPNCINPEHLLVGTLADNNYDRFERGRSAIGERCGSARLTTKDVEIIRADLSLSIRQAAKRFGVGKSTVQQIRAGEIWKHLLPDGDPRKLTPVRGTRKGVTKEREREIGKMAAAIRWGIEPSPCVGRNAEVRLTTSHPRAHIDPHASKSPHEAVRDQGAPIQVSAPTSPLADARCDGRGTLSTDTFSVGSQVAGRGTRC